MTLSISGKTKNKQNLDLSLRASKQRLKQSSEALKLIKDMEPTPNKKASKHTRSPLAGINSHNLHKGHPLAEHHHDSTPQLPTKKRLRKKNKFQGHKSWGETEIFLAYLQPDGKLLPIEDFNFKGHEKPAEFSKYEIASSSKPAVAASCYINETTRDSWLRAGSDPGNIRCTQKQMIKSLLEQYVTSRMVAYGAMEVETPSCMITASQPSGLSESFPSSSYLLKKRRQRTLSHVSLRASDSFYAPWCPSFIQQMPLKLYELTRNSFRPRKAEK